MRILIFGGGNSFKEYYDFFTDYWKEAEICAILDNDKGKWGVIYGISIVSPADVHQYKYDIILICSIYEDEIKKQLINEFGVDKKIETRRDFFDKVIFPWYEKKYKNKKILIVGERFKFNLQHQLYDEFFDIVGFVSLDEITLINGYDFDYILLAIYDRKKEIEAADQIVYSGCAKRECLLTDDLFRVYKHQIKYLSNGEKYPDKKFLLVSFWGAGGLGAICSRAVSAVSYARQNGYIPVVDMKSFWTQYLEEEEYGTVNAWEKFFLQPDQYTMDDIKEAKHVLQIFWPRNWEPVYEDNVLSWFPKMKDTLSEKVKKYIKKFENKRVLGVLFRGTDYSRQKPFGHYIQPDLSSMLSITRQKIKEWGVNLIFLCTEVRQACEQFDEVFGDKVLHYPQLRYDAEMDVPVLALYSFGIPGERTRRGEDYWIALNILAACDSLIAGRCNGT